MFNRDDLLKGKTVVITGASKGIGKATADLLRSYDVNLALGSRTLKKQSNYQELQHSLDVTDESSVKQFLALVLESFGSADIVINCAGVGKFADILESSTEDFDQMLAVNLKGTYLIAKYFGRHMSEKSYGKILNILSIAATTALNGCGGYTASKAGALGLTRVLQTELRKKGVEVTAVLPGSINSSFWDGMESTPPKKDMIPVNTMAQHIINIMLQPPGSVIDEVTIMPPYGIL